MLALLAAYPLLLGLLAEALGRFAVADPAGQATLLPGTTSGLLETCAENFGLFALLFAGAWAFARPSADDLGARWRRPWITLGLGAAWSVGLRVLVTLLVSVVAVILVVSQKLGGHGPASLDAFRPKVENLLNPAALHDPVYLLITVSLVSFVVAGLREELWRAGMLTAFNALLPAKWRNRWGQAAAISFAAVIFGLGHLPQGVAGVVLTGVLGLGLGWIMTYHRSLWIAVLAHGFFDATSFVGIWALERYGLLDQLIPK
jgi:membrane protease YdiL (CAAX protease family)